MKIIQTFALILVTSFLFAQDIPRSTETGKAEYKNGANIAGLTSKSLYERGFAWVNKFYTNPNGVMETQDAEGGKIVGRARFRLSRIENKKHVNPNAGFVSYQITLQFKDGKYRYILDAIRWEKPSYYDVSQWSDSTQNNYNKQEYTSYVEQTIRYFDELTKNLENYMKIGEAEKKDDW
ncbi:MAG: hypothetical protein ACI9JN_001166 [Bacteroidia bacterium]|jgi:hypothetical protein